jgi:hypothetical protein
MLPILNFFGNHTLDFANTNYDDLKYYTISELRKLDTPGDLLLIEYDALNVQLKGKDKSIITSIDNWAPLAFPDIPDIPGFSMKNHIVAIGPMAMRIVFTTKHILLPSFICERVDWYSPVNKEKVKAIRPYYHALINLFGGDHALYVDENIIDKYYPSNSSLASFEQTLVARYGKSRKTLFDYSKGKYPKYYIDTFTDVK